MPDGQEHYRKLERMYLSAPVNREIYKGIQLLVEEKRAELQLMIEAKYYHAAHSLHGSVYFKLLDDAAFFAVQSIVQDVFIYTVSYNIQILRPVTNGVLKSIGELKFKSNSLFIADANLFDSENKLVGRGSGSFMKSRISLTKDVGYI